MSVINVRASRRVAPGPRTVKPYGLFKQSRVKGADGPAFEYVAYVDARTVPEARKLLAGVIAAINVPVQLVKLDSLA